MKTHAAAQEDDFQALDSRLVIRVLHLFLALALLSAAIIFAGKWAGRLLAMAGHTDDTTIHEIVIGNTVLAVPANAIRFARTRRSGVAQRLDLYLRWPDMAGYADGRRDDFNNTGNRRTMLFLSFEQSSMAHDMSGRLGPIYRSLIYENGKELGAGVKSHRFTETSGYLNEMLAVAENAAGAPFVARCLTGAGASESLAPCERDIDLGNELSLVYRFPEHLLPAWRSLDAAVLAKAKTFIRAAP